MTWHSLSSWIATRKGREENIRPRFLITTWWRAGRNSFSVANVLLRFRYLPSPRAGPEVGNMENPSARIRDTYEEFIRAGKGSTRMAFMLISVRVSGVQFCDMPFLSFSFSLVFLDFFFDPVLRLPWGFRTFPSGFNGANGAGSS